MILLIFAFLAGFFTVLSPCILPILPALLSAGTAQGKWRPLGIILGLICSFSFFTLTLTAIVQATHISPNILRDIAIALIFLFGIIMIFPKLSIWFAKITNPLASLGQRLQGTSPTTGFWGGILFGIALGLLWTPCAGPILAAITTLVATRTINFFAILMTLSYSIGAAIPMFLIAYGGGKIIQSSHYLSSHAERIRQFFGAIMILVALVLFFHWDMLLEQKLISYTPNILEENNPTVQGALEKLRNKQPMREIPKLSELGKAPELTGIVGWINSPPLTLEQLRGKVVLIDFWTYSCINCLRTLPFLEKWYADYKDQGLVIIGVHTPEFEFEKNSKNVEEATKRLGVEYPVALDNNYKTWEAYHNSYWPAHYLIDKDGNLRMVHYGEGAYAETENQIRDLLNLPPLKMVETEKAVRPITPETYLGISRGRSYAQPISLKPDQVANYNYIQPLQKNEVGLKGPWLAESEYIMAEGNDCYLDLHYLAKQVYLVLGGSSTTPLEISLDGMAIKKIVVDGDRKYDIISANYGEHYVSIKIPSGIKAYVFTFGDE